MWATRIWLGVALLLMTTLTTACDGLSCSSGSVSTTTPMATVGVVTTTSTIATTTTAPPTTTTSTTSTTSTTLGPMETYRAEMRAWKNTYAADLEESYDVISKMGNPLNASDEEIQAAKDLDDSMDGMVSDLDDIQPPPEMSSAHTDYLASLEDMADGVHDLANGLEKGSAWRSLAAIAAITIAWEQGTPARTTLERALGFSLSSAD